ncbi:MAG: GLPGLI family protein [Flavobacteriia bacterium]|nr:GLPGLI family protein [Flavobacteriia bacterium]
MAGIKINLIALLLIMGNSAFSQITAGRIVFERKTNLEKKFKDSPMGGRMMKDMQNSKSKIDKFELFFNDTCSIFKPILSDEADPLSWATSKNTVYQSENSQMRFMILNLMGQEIFVSDSMTTRKWKITENKRTICNYECRKAIWQKNDSTRIYAWFSVDIVPSVGPEGFSGLPGAILGLATEDGGIIYFAKSVEIVEPKAESFTVNPKKKKAFTYIELKAKLEEEYGNTPWGKRIFDDLFRWM